jgi:hypothetical protein
MDYENPTAIWEIIEAVKKVKTAFHWDRKKQRFLTNTDGRQKLKKLLDMFPDVPYAPKSKERES